MRFFVTPSIMTVCLPGLCTLLMTTGCRTSLRQQIDDGEPTKISMLVAGIRHEDSQKSDLVYTLSGCGIGSANGTKKTETTVEFLTKGVKVDDSCDVKIQSGQASTPGIKWFGDQGLLYEARRIKITSKEGRLSGIAVLQQLYTTPVGDPGDIPNIIWSISAAVEAPKPLLETCTCKIQCAPNLKNDVAQLVVSADKKSGVCQFVNLIYPQFSKTVCQQMVVQCGADLYKGIWSNTPVIDGSTKSDTKLPDLKLMITTPDEMIHAEIKIEVPKPN